MYGRKEPVGYPVFIVLYRGGRRTLVCQPCLIMRLKRMNMNKEPDFFSNITPTSGGLIIIALGVLLLIGAIRRWKWVFDMTGERNKGFNFLLFLYDLFGDKGLRVGVIITSVIIILGGIEIMCFYKR